MKAEAPTTYCHNYQFITSLRYNKMMSEISDVNGKIVLVTGASSGIGEAVAIRFANAGAKVALCARREQKLKEIHERLKAQGKHCVYYKLDVTDRQQFKSTVAAVQNDLGPVDILVNNAGVMYYTHMIKLLEEDWEKTIDINCKGVTNGVGAVLKGMVERKRGHIINMSSDAGRRGFAGLAVYSGTKFYVEGFSQALRHEVQEHNIRVTTIQPGNVATELASHTRDAEALKEFGDSTGHKVLCPDDIARAVLYAASQPEYVAANEILIEPRDEPI